VNRFITFIAQFFINKIHPIFGCSPNKQQKIAEKTLNLFVPGAEKLGLVALGKELQELSLEVLSKKS
jgi:(p)ppGpp synthase/HD superfamily hydrolase